MIIVTVQDPLKGGFKKLVDLPIRDSSVHGKKSTRSEKAIDFMLVASVEI